MAQKFRAAAGKRFIPLSLATAMLLTLFTGCGSAGSQTSTSPAGQPTPAASEMAVQTPETGPSLPADLLGNDLNVYSDVSFPEGYFVYAAGFENNVNFYFYDLYLTAQGKPEDIITYVSTLLGAANEAGKEQSIKTFHSNGGVGIDGQLDGKGLFVNCKITPTNENDYDYDYVDGCALRLRAAIDDPTSYNKIIEDNYNLGSLSPATDYFDLTPITGKSGIYVRKSRNNAQIDAVYNTVGDVANVMKRMKAELSYEGYDDNSHIMTLTRYGEVRNSILFDLENNSISIFQNLGDSGRSFRDYKPASTKLTDLGFQNYIETDALCEYRDDVSGLSIAVNIPKWGSRPDEWENSCVQFLKEINGYLLAIWYYPDEGRYTVQADKDDTSAKYEYQAGTGEFGGEYPDTDAVKAQFGKMYSGREVKDVNMEGIYLFQGYVKDTFGMSVDELYALAADE